MQNLRSHLLGTGNLFTHKRRHREKQKQNKKAVTHVGMACSRCLEVVIEGNCFICPEPGLWGRLEVYGAIWSVWQSGHLWGSLEVRGAV